MNLQELLRKPVRLVVENNIQEDIVLSTDPISKLVAHTTRLMGGNVLDFLIAVTDSRGKLDAVITNREAPVFIDFLVTMTQKQGFNADHHVSTLALAAKMPVKFSVNRDTDSILKAYELLQSDVTDIVVAVDTAGKYVGKIKRNNFFETTKSLLS